MNGGAMQSLAPQHFSMINTYPYHNQQQQIQQKQRILAQQQQQQLHQNNSFDKINLNVSSQQKVQGSWVNGPPTGSITTGSLEENKERITVDKVIREKKEKPINPNYMNKLNPNNKAYVPSRNPKIAHGEYMTASDVKFVVSKVLQPLETPDPYADDYYYLQTGIKSNNKLRDAAINSNEELPPLIFVPLPTWKDTKERLRKQLEEARGVQYNRSRKWEEKEKVLGHTQKSDISRPKELLSVPSMHDLEDIEYDELGGFKLPFTSR